MRGHLSVIRNEGAAVYDASDWHSVSCFESNCPFVFCDLPSCTEKTVIPTSYIICTDRYRWRDICKSLVLVIIINTSGRFFSKSALLFISNWPLFVFWLVSWVLLLFFPFFFFCGFCVLLAVVGLYFFITFCFYLASAIALMCSSHCTNMVSR